MIKIILNTSFSVSRVLNYHRNHPRWHGLGLQKGAGLAHAPGTAEVVTRRRSKEERKGPASWAVAKG